MGDCVFRHWIIRRCALLAVCIGRRPMSGLCSRAVVGSSNSRHWNNNGSCPADYDYLSLWPHIPSWKRLWSWREGLLPLRNRELPRWRKLWVHTRYARLVRCRPVAPIAFWGKKHMLLYPNSSIRNQYGGDVNCRIVSTLPNFYCCYRAPSRPLHYITSLNRERTF